MLKSFPTFEFEKPLWEKDYLVVGIDEVGRGALAGPLGVGAVAFRIPNAKYPISNSQYNLSEIENMGINDSKKISEEKRERISKVLRFWSSQNDSGVLFAENVHVDVATINEFGISKAFEIGVQNLVDQCIAGFPDRKLFILIDGNFNFRINGIDNAKKQSIIRGDALSLSIAAASIIAKVARDNYMKSLSEAYPQYGFEKHVGYGTAIHRAAIKEFGRTDMYRDLYIRNILNSV